MENISHLDIMIGLGLLFVGIGGFIFSNAQRYFTLREHAEFKKTLDRELDRLQDRIITLEQSYKQCVKRLPDTK